jgi:hypothetical protein
MSMDILKEIAGSGKAWAAERAIYAIQITEAAHAGDISMGEYRELMQDLVRMDRLDAEADDMAMKAALVSAVYVVANLA